MTACTAPSDRGSSSFSAEPAVADDLAAQDAGHLHGRRADPSRGGVHEDPRSGAHVRLSGEREPGREERHQEGRALLERRPGRQVEQPCLVHGDPLRVAAPCLPWQSEHAPSVSRLAGDLRAGHPGKLGHLRVLAAPDQHVGEVDPGRTDVDEHLSVLERRVRRLGAR